MTCSGSGGRASPVRKERMQRSCGKSKPIAGGDDQGGAGDPREILAHVEAGHAADEAELRRECRHAHKPGPAVPHRGRAVRAEAAGHCPSRPALHVMLLDMSHPGGVAIAERLLTGHQGAQQHQAGHPLRPGRCQPDRDRPRDLGGYQGEAFQPAPAGDPEEVLDQPVEAPAVVSRHGRASPQAAHVRSNDPRVPPEPRHPGVPGLAALGVAVQQQRVVPWRPRVGEALVVVEQASAVGRVEEGQGGT